MLYVRVVVYFILTSVDSGMKYRCLKKRRRQKRKKKRMTIVK